MSLLVNSVERSETRRRDEELQVVIRGEKEDSGTIKDVYQGLRDNKVKVMHEDDFDSEVHERLTGTDLVPQAEITERDWRDIGYHENTVVVNQNEADQDLENAIEEFGIDEVIDDTVNNLLDEFTDRGIVYKDPQNNIAFFEDQPKPFDVYDTGAFILFDNPEELSENEMYLFEGAAANMYKQFTDDIAEKSSKDNEYITDKVVETSDYLDGSNNSDFFTQLFEYS